MYSTIQEEGGKIVPKSAKHLSVPLPPALTDRGVSRYTTVREAVEAEKLFYVRTGTGTELLAKRTGKKDLEPWYVLKG